MLAALVSCFARGIGARHSAILRVYVDRGKKSDLPTILKKILVSVAKNRLADDFGKAFANS